MGVSVGSEMQHNNPITTFEQKIKLKSLAPLKEGIASNPFFKLDYQ
jgi:hypothetical protein